LRATLREMESDKPVRGVIYELRESDMKKTDELFLRVSKEEEGAVR